MTKSNEFIHVIPAQPDLMATVIWADPYCPGGPEARVEFPYRVIGWGITSNGAIPILDGYDWNKAAGKGDDDDPLTLLLIPQPNGDGFRDRNDRFWRSIEDASAHMVRRGAQHAAAFDYLGRPWDSQEAVAAFEAEQRAAAEAKVTAARAAKQAKPRLGTYYFSTQR
jgi:hypothetical protein